MSKPDQVNLSESIPGPPAEGADSENVLILSPDAGDRCDRTCAEHLQVPSGPGGAVIFVTLTEAPDRRIQVLRDHASRPPARVGVICAGESRRGGSVNSRGVAVRSVENPGDLARLGVGISDALESWADDHPTTVCFHSLTSLLQFVELSRVFRFVYTLGGRVAQSGARAHFHLDPDAYDEDDEQVVATLSPLFDSVLRVTEDGRERVS